MRYFANILASKVTAHRDLLKPDERYRVAVIESVASIVGNLLLTLLKLTFGFMVNSVALIADAVHSASDVFSSLIVLLGFSMAKKKPDREHPYGHGRSEYLAGLVIAVMLVAAGAVFAYNAYTRLISGVFAQPNMAAIVAILGAILIKEFLFYFSAKLGALIDSDVLTGDAWHHRSDTLSSILVLVALVGGYLGMPALDAYLGFGVALFLLYTGYKIARSSCHRLLGPAPPEDLTNGVVTCAREIDGVVDAHDLEIHDYGSWKIVTLHIGVDGSMNLKEAHSIAHRVEERVSECFHCETVVHLDPR